MSEQKQIDKAATVQSLVEWANRSIGHGLNTTNLNAAMQKADWEETLIGCCKCAEIPVIYK